MKLAQGSASIANAQNETVSSGVKKETESIAASSTTDKLKASNFPATLLRIGSWEVCLRHNMSVLYLDYLLFP